MEIKFKSNIKDDIYVNQSGNKFKTIYDDILVEIAQCCQLLPYIGIKDTNGKELYLNDDIRIDGIGVVRIVFQQAAFGFVIDNNFYSFAHEITNEWHMVEGCVQEIELLKNEAAND